MRLHSHARSRIQRVDIVRAARSPPQFGTSTGHERLAVRHLPIEALEVQAHMCNTARAAHKGVGKKLFLELFLELEGGPAGVSADSARHRSGIKGDATDLGRSVIRASGRMGWLRESVWPVY